MGGDAAATSAGASLPATAWQGVVRQGRAVHPVTTMDRPLQVILDEEDRRQARRRAAELGLSMPEYLRRLVRADLDGWQPSREPIAIIPIDDSGEPMSTRRDVSIGEAVAARFAKSQE